MEHHGAPWSTMEAMEDHGGKKKTMEEKKDHGGIFYILQKNPFTYSNYFLIPMVWASEAKNDFTMEEEYFLCLFENC